MPTDLFWQIVKAPSGMTLESANANTLDANGYHNRATLNWTPSARDLAKGEGVRSVDKQTSLLYMGYLFRWNSSQMANLQQAAQQNTATSND